MTGRMNILFPVLAVALSIVASFAPSYFVPLKGQIVPLLGIVMFGMGITLHPADFMRVLKRPLPVGIGVLLQFALMPLAGFMLYKLLSLPPELAAGVVLLGSCPGGTASNVICFLARGDLALSITLTAVSTLLGIFLTPLLTLLYIGETVDVPAAKMLIGMVKIVFLPVALGILANRILGSRGKRIRESFPAVSVIAIVIIIAIVVALNKENILGMGAAVAMVVVLHNLIGLGAGYGFATLLRQEGAVRRTIAIEVGMQNSGLAVLLATKYFTPVAALPGALFSVWHNLSGSLLAAFWGRRS